MLFKLYKKKQFPNFDIPNRNEDKKAYLSGEIKLRENMIFKVGNFIPNKINNTQIWGINVTKTKVEYLT